MYPDYPFDYFFQEDYFNDLYKADRSMGSLFKYFTLLGILIAMLGLFGLILFSAGKRTKEIGIRKTMGSSIVKIVLLLVRQIPVQVLLASLIALPSGWFFAEKWLENFAEKTSISWWIYLLSVLAAAIISLIAMAYHTIKTARSNPVEALRYE